MGILFVNLVCRNAVSTTSNLTRDDFELEQLTKLLTFFRLFLPIVIVFIIQETSIFHLHIFRALF